MRFRNRFCNDRALEREVTSAVASEVASAVASAVASEVASDLANPERSNLEWPEQVTIKLHLRGLESLKITNGHVTLQASLPSGVKRPNLRLSKDALETLLNTKSPYWMDVRMFNSDAKPAESIPLNDGYFLIRLPKVLFESAEPQGVTPTSISLSWIDFYR